MTKIIELIFTEVRRGNGTPDSPTRVCSQLWTKDGRLIVEYDPHEPEASHISSEISGLTP